MRVAIKFSFIVILWLAFTILGKRVNAQQPNPSPPLFQDVTQQAGITMRRLGGGPMSKDKSIGQAWGDYDRDGWLDLYVTDSKGPNVLYRNTGMGTFVQSPISATLALTDSESAGAVWGDYNNDGWLDLFVTAWGPDTLFRNEQGKGFSDVTATAGVSDKLNSKSASWGDYNNDGFIDLYVANWACEPKCGRPFVGDEDQFYRNNGDGSFSNVTDLLSHQVEGAGFVASFVDYDNDNDSDLYLVNDEYINPVGNALWRNDGPGCAGWCFTDVSKASGSNVKVMGMGLAIADYDGNGYFDFYFSNVGAAELLQNQGDGTFKRMAKSLGVQAKWGVSWGTTFFDYDRDGWQDLYLTIAAAVSDGTTQNRLWHNNGVNSTAPITTSTSVTNVVSFSDVSEGSGVDDRRKSLGVAYADYDNDGWVDLLVGNYAEGYRLYRNLGNAGVGNNWLTIELTGGGKVNRDAIGARVTITSSDGRMQTQQVINGSSLGGGSALALYFGLGKATIRSLEVHWPDGKVQSMKNVKANQVLTVRYQ